MKKFIAWTLVLVLCLGMFAGCAEKPVESTPAGTTAGVEENTEGLEKAAKYLKALYITSPAETGVDFVRTTVVPVGTEKYTVTWTVDVAEDLVKIVEGTDNTVTIDVNEDNTTETPYKLTATVADAKGNTKTVVFDHILPKAVAKDGTEFTVAEIIAMGSAKDHNTYTDYKYKVTGVITEVYNDTYGNMYITDGEGNTLTIYGTFDADGTNRYDAMAVKPVAGDTVTIYGIVGQYNGNAQIKNGWIVAHTPGEGSGDTTDPTEPAPTEPAPTEPSTGNNGNTGNTTPSVPTTLAGQIAEANKLANKEYLSYKSTITGTITDDPQASSYTAGAYKFTVSDGTNTLLCYYTPVTGGTPAKGDKVTVTGYLTAYNGTAQFDDTASAVVTKTGNTETPSTPSTPSTSLSVVSTLEVGKAYKFGMVQQNAGKTVYLAGGMDGYYMATTENASTALDVYVENANGGYYLYTFISGTKTYINMVISTTHVNGAYETTAKTVYTWDADAKTLVATMQPEGKEAEPYWFGTRSDKSYTTVGPCAVSYAGFYCNFYA